MRPRSRMRSFQLLRKRAVNPRGKLTTDLERVALRCLTHCKRDWEKRYIMELQYEHIDWSDIVDAELSGDQEALRELRSAPLPRLARCPARSPLSSESSHTSVYSPPSLPHRDRAAEMKREKQARPRRQKDAQSPVSRGSGGDGSQPPRRVPDSLSARPVDPTEYPMIGQQADKENSTTALPFSSHTSSAGGERANAASYAQMVTRKAKRTLVDRCLSPCEAPVNKRHVTSDIMKTPTEFKTFFHHGPSPSCETTPETGR